ncbi:unnamed protein product [Prorocentrum cordatum]|uniref:Peptidase C14 caspase domain-containing protein n=1 Tax=Prorocentrum cordatum TaxID=2364126 RepID=A0ABN9UJL5_9DINO|nr:unnamed protein product [Polarella glacialis]
MQGAFTWAWVKALVAGHLDPPTRQLHAALHSILADLQQRFSWMDQTPVVQLSTAAKLREALKEESRRGLRAGIPRQPLPQNHQRRRALLVGVSYAESHAPLKGCVNDAWNMHCLLRSVFQFGEDQVQLLADGENGRPPEPGRAPSLERIREGLRWLTEDGRPGDQLLFCYCGHGAQHPASPGAEAHQAYLVPSDFAADLPAGFTGQLDQPVPAEARREGYRLLPLLELCSVIAGVPAGVTMTVVLDCSYPMLPGVGPTRDEPVSFSKVERGRVDYRKLQDFVSRPRFIATWRRSRCRARPRSAAPRRRTPRAPCAASPPAASRSGMPSSPWRAPSRARSRGRSSRPWPPASSSAACTSSGRRSSASLAASSSTSRAWSRLQRSRSRSQRRLRTPPSRRPAERLAPGVRLRPEVAARARVCKGKTCIWRCRGEPPVVLGRARPATGGFWKTPRTSPTERLAVR